MAANNPLISKTSEIDVEIPDVGLKSHMLMGVYKSQTKWPRLDQARNSCIKCYPTCLSENIHKVKDWEVKGKGDLLLNTLQLFSSCQLKIHRSFRCDVFLL